MKRLLQIFVLLALLLVTLLSATACSGEYTGDEYLERDLKIFSNLEPNRVYRPYVNVRRVWVKFQGKLEQPLDFRNYRKLEAVYFECKNENNETASADTPTDISVIKKSSFKYPSRVKIYVNTQEAYDYSVEKLAGAKRTVLVDKDFNPEKDIPLTSKQSVLMTDTIGYMFLPAILVVLVLALANQISRHRLIDKSGVFKLGVGMCICGVIGNVIATFTHVGAGGVWFFSFSVYLGLGMVLCFQSLHYANTFLCVLFRSLAYGSFIGIIVWICLFFSSAGFTFAFIISVGGVIFAALYCLFPHDIDALVTTSIVSVAVTVVSAGFMSRWHLMFNFFAG